MRPVIRVSAVVAIALALVVVSCRKEGDAKSPAQVVKVAQDTMLLHDLAEANKNTAAAGAVDNSLGTVKTNPDGSAALVSNASPSTPTNRVVPRTTSETEKATPTSANTPRMTVPTQASDAHPTTVPLSRSPANSAATRSSGDPCDSPTTTDQRYCLNRSIVANDADLNSTYQDLLDQARKSGGSDLEERFRQSQREWVNQRDSECRSRAPVESGKLWARALGRCLADYSSQRTSELKRNLSSLR
ncbi:MAG TPA: lysozyme inhibitor LprI family protein, partial [Gemmatimonadaceae bacterium]|nr:lysozyme inhibitor LprI family protein [Gemmatimonadaceae bacterium]